MGAAKSQFMRIAAFALAAIGLLVSVLALYAKLYFWGGTQHADIYVKAAIWFVIAAGPLSLWLASRKPYAAIAVAAAQFALIAIASM